MANLFDNLGNRIFSQSNSLVQEGLAKAIPGDNFLAKSAKSFIGSQAERLLSNALLPGGANSNSVRGMANISFNAENDIRARLALSPQSGPLFYKDSSNALMRPLAQTDGVVWPYTPNINVS